MVCTKILGACEMEESPKWWINFVGLTVKIGTVEPTSMTYLGKEMKILWFTS